MKTLKIAALAAAIAVVGAMAQAQDFDGFYIGGGLGWSKTDVGADEPVAGAQEMPDPSGFNGFTVAGYNKSYGNLIVGVEGDLSFGEIDGTGPCSNPSWTCEAKIKNSATLRGRVGTVAGGNFLFASLGYSAAKVELATVNSSGTSFPDSHTLFGWTAGVGAERPLQHGWNMRGEILYTDYNGTDYRTDVAYPEMGASVTTLRVGVSRKF